MMGTEASIAARPPLGPIDVIRQVRKTMETPMATISLDPDEALVLFELVSRLTAGDEPTIRFQHPSEEAALWALEGALEKILVEPLKPNYRELLQVAQQRLGARTGTT
jgi:hypothetical protein